MPRKDQPQRRGASFFLAQLDMLGGPRPPDWMVSLCIRHGIQYSSMSSVSVKMSDSSVVAADSTTQENSADMESTLSYILSSMKNPDFRLALCPPEDREEEDPIRIFQNCWGWKRNDDAWSFDQAGREWQSKASAKGWGGDQGDFPRKKRISEGIFLNELMAQILRKGWNSDTQQTLKTKIQDLQPFHVSQILKGVQEIRIAKQIFEWARQQPKYKHSTCSYNAMAIILASSKEPILWRTFLDQMAKDGCEPDKITYCTLIKGYSKAQKPHQVLKLYKQMCESQLEPGIATYSCIIAVLAKHGYMEKASQVYFDMRMNGCCLDRTGFNILINCFGRERNLHMARRLFREMSECGLQPDACTYTALIQSYLMLDDAISAHSLFDEVEGKGLSISLQACNLLMHSLGKVGKVDFALGVFHKFDRLGLTPDLISFKTLIVLCGKNSRLHDVVSLVEDMASRGLAGKLPASAHAVEWLCDQVNVKAACSFILSAMKKHGVMDAAANDLLLDNIVKLDAVDQGLLFLLDLAALGYKPVVQKLSNLVRKLGEAGNVDGALKMFYAMEHLGCSPDLLAYDGIIGCLVRTGSFYQAVRFFDEMICKNISLDASVCNNLINAFCKEKDMKSAIAIFEKMKAKGCASNVSTYNNLIAGFANISDWKMALKLSKDMEINGLTADSGTYLPLILSLGNEGRMDHAMRLCSHMLQEGLKPPSEACHKLVKFLVGKGSNDKVESIFLKLKSMGEFVEFSDFDSFAVGRQVG